MVRLLRDHDISTNNALVMFQSHNGAIAAISTIAFNKILSTVSIPQWCDCCVAFCKLEKRGKEVSIPQWCDCCLSGILQKFLRYCFNPTMVRLLQLSELPRLRWLAVFQSHNGAIAARITRRQADRILVSIPQWCDCCLLKLNWTATQDFEFQSHNGAIAAQKIVEIVRELPEVSIPQWCDCCQSLRRYLYSVMLVSIPQWCDCCLKGRHKEPEGKEVSIPQWCDCCLITN